MVNPSAFFDSLAAIIGDPMYIGRSSADLDQELRTNTWSISCSLEQAQQLTLNDFLQFFEQVIENRRQQLQAAQSVYGMLFYLWYDEQAIQLRFGLISDFDGYLPFSASVNRVPSMVSIIEEFLLSHHHDGIPWQELEIDDFDATAPILHPDDDLKPILDVFVLNL